MKQNSIFNNLINRINLSRTSSVLYISRVEFVYKQKWLYVLHVKVTKDLSNKLNGVSAPILHPLRLNLETGRRKSSGCVLSLTLFQSRYDPQSTPLVLGRNPVWSLLYGRFPFPVTRILLGDFLLPVSSALCLPVGTVIQGVLIPPFHRVPFLLNMESLRRDCK